MCPVYYTGQTLVFLIMSELFLNFNLFFKFGFLLKADISFVCLINLRFYKTKIYY